MKSKLLLKFCLLWMLYIPIEVKAQALKYTITYNSKTKNYSRCAKGEENLLSPMDRVNMRPYQEERSYTIKVLANGDRETTISYNHSSQIGNDKSQVFKTIIDKNGVKSYDRNGKMVVNMPHSAIYKEHYKSMIKENDAQGEDKHGPDFKKITEADINSIKTQGGKIKELPNKGGHHIRRGNNEVLYDTLNKIIEERTFEGSKLKYSHTQKFKTNSAGKIIPLFKKEIKLSRTDKGNNLWNFKEEEIINYKVTYPLNGRSVAEENLPFNVYPNPTSKEINVRLPRSVYEKTPTISIYDMLGKMVFQKQTNLGLETINTEVYAKGVYILQVDSGEGEILTQKFIKQ